MAILLFSVQASAHEIWAMAENPEAVKPLVGFLGYGHHFPEGEDIAADRLSIFYPVEIINSKGEKLPTKPGDTNYKVVTEAPVEAGTYLVTAGYKPTFWSSGPAGSVMKAKNEAPGTTSCESWARYAKGVVNIGGAVDDFVTKPLGTRLELVPLVNPGTVKVDGDLVVQALYEGQPLEGAEVKGTVAGNRYAEGSNRDFYAKTDSDGKFTFQPTKAGLWTFVVESYHPYADTSVCDQDALDATLTVTIGQ